MYQQQVNNNNNNINSALDCSESRTVRTICTKHVQQQQHTAKVPPLTGAFDFITKNTVTREKTATKVAPTAEMQNACQTRSLRRKPMMKTYALLPIICIVICAQISTTSGRTLLERKQILHSLQNRMLHHKNLMRYEREYAPKNIVHLRPRHHLNARSIPMMCPGDFIEYLQRVRNQSHISRQTLKDMIDSFTNVRFTQTSRQAFEAWSKHNLSLLHPYTHMYSRHIDNNVTSHNFTHLKEQEMSAQLLDAEISKIVKTLKALKVVYNETVNESNKQEWSNRYQSQYGNIINFLERTYTELVINENVVKDIINSRKLEIKDETIAPTYNRTAQVREWLLIVESLSFLGYLTQLCETLIQMCY